MNELSLAGTILRISELYDDNAYLRAYQSINDFIEEHKQEPTLEEAQKLKFIDDSILRDIREYQFTGNISRLEKLRRPTASNGVETSEPEQPTKLKRTTVNSFKDDLKDLDIVFKIAGSYRRGKRYMSDIDMVVNTNDPVHVIVKKIKTKFDLEDISGKDEFYSGWIKLEQDGKIHSWRLDITTANSKSWATMLLYFTGPVKFNIQMRSKAKSIGLKLNRYGLMTREGSPIRTDTEFQIFELLNLKYLAPSERDQKLEPISTWIVIADETKYIRPQVRFIIPERLKHTYPHLKVLYPEALFYRIP